MFNLCKILKTLEKLRTPPVVRIAVNGIKSNNDWKIPTVDISLMNSIVPGLFKLQDLLKTPTSPKIEIFLHQAGPGTYRQVLKELRHKDIYNLIVDTDPHYMPQFFRAVSIYHLKHVMG